MSISMKAALTLEILQQSQVIAGHKGLDRIIKWVSILEVLDEVTFLQEGDLLVTTAYGLIDNPRLTRDLVPFLAERKLAGLAIQTGYYLKVIPAQIIKQCDLYELPLLELPKSISFNELTKAILKKVINTQIEMLEYTQKIRHRFTQVILKNEGVAQIACILSELLDTPVCIFDKSFNILYNHGITEDNKYLLNDIHKKEPSLLEPTQSNRTPNIYTQVLQPLIAGNEIHGFIYVVPLNHSLNEMEMSALSTAATTCTLEILKTNAVQEAEDRIKGDFLDDLLEGRVTSKEAIHRRANYLGYDISQKFLILCIDIDDFGLLSALKKESEIQEIKKRLFFTVRSCLQSFGSQTLLKHQSDMITVLLQISPQAKDMEYVRQIAQQICKNTKQELPITLSIGIGDACPDLINISSSYREANQALSISKKLLGKDQVVFYRDLGVYKLFTNATDDTSTLRAYYHESLEPLVEYDRNHNSALTKTLEVFVQNNGGIKEAAEKLFIHRHTLTYRLNRIHEITGLNPEDYQARFQLQLGLIVARLLGNI